MDTFAFGDPFATTGGQTGKRPRDEEEEVEGDDVQAGREISRTITEDADFVSSLLDETPNKLQCQGGRDDFGTASSWQQQPSTAFMLNNNNAMQPGLASMQQQAFSNMPALDTLSNSGHTMMMPFSTDGTFFPQQPPFAAQPIENNRTMFVERWTCDVVSRVEECPCSIFVPIHTRTYTVVRLVL